MKQKSIGVGFLAMLLAVAFFVASTGLVMAAETPAKSMVVAEVNLYEARIVSQSGNKLTVSFDINNRSGIQSGVRYGIDLKQAAREGEFLPTIIAKVFDETLLLKAGETIHKEVVYDVPGYADGEYEVWIISQNEKGLPLGLGMAGKTTFRSTGAYVRIIDETCTLKIKDEVGGKQYTRLQGVDIDQNDTLEATCVMENSSTEDIQSTLKMETRYRNIYGDLVSTDDGPSVNIVPNKKALLSFPLPKAEKPQAYDVAVTLMDSKGKAVSNPVVLHYVLRGASGTIQNVKLDKETYLKGETAKISFFWTGAADSFANARKTASQIGQVKIEVEISDGNGKLCAPVLERETDASASRLVELQAVIESDCRFPEASAAIKDAKGSVLDRTDFSLEERRKTDSQIQSTPADISKEIKTKWPVVGLIALVPLVIYALFRIFGKSGKIPPTVIFLIAISVLFISGEVEADTIYAGDAIYVVNYNKSTFFPGEAIIASAYTVQASVCSNMGGWMARLDGSFPDTNPASSGNIFAGECHAGGCGSCCDGYTWCIDPGCSGATSGNLSGTVGDQLGVRYGYFSGHWMDHVGYYQTPSYPMPYTVLVLDADGACGAAAGQVFATAPASNLCDSTGGNTPVTDTGTDWTWTCNGTGTGQPASCSANKPCSTQYEWRSLGIFPSCAGKCGQIVTAPPLCIEQCTAAIVNNSLCDFGTKPADQTKSCPACPAENTYREVQP